jgi:lipid-binding SYLF domain-containing protein
MWERCVECTVASNALDTPGIQPDNSRRASHDRRRQGRRATMISSAHNWGFSQRTTLEGNPIMTSKLIDSPSRRNALGVLAAASLAGCATQTVSPAEPERLVADAQTTLSNFIRDPAQTWIQDNLGRARALLIAPQVVRAGFIFGGSGGRGVLVARDGRAWVGPAFYNLATASVGFQAGIDVSEVLIVVMTDRGFNSLLSTSFKVGGEASVAAGPVGAGAGSTVTADLITFTRARGVFGGLNLDGTVVSTNVAWNDAFFGGSNLLPPDILIRRTVTSPKAAGLLADVAKATK